MSREKNPLWDELREVALPMVRGVTTPTKLSDIIRRALAKLGKTSEEDYRKAYLTVWPPSLVREFAPHIQCTDKILLSESQHRCIKNALITVSDPATVYTSVEKAGAAERYGNNKVAFVEGLNLRLLWEMRQRKEVDDAKLHRMLKATMSETGVVYSRTPESFVSDPPKWFRGVLEALPRELRVMSIQDGRVTVCDLLVEPETAKVRQKKEPRPKVSSRKQNFGAKYSSAKGQDCEG